MFFRQLKHLLPNARAWSLTASKQLREFFQGLSTLGSDVRDFVDLVWLDVFPDSTRELTLWEDQFGLSADGLTDTERRAKIDAAWKATGGQSPRYIQDTLQAAGFDVYLHEWWEPGTEPAVGVKACVPARNPNSYLVSPPSDLLEGYALVNKLFTSRSVIIPRAGEENIACGEPATLCGNYTRFEDLPKEYPLPLDSDKWPYFLYIGAETFPDLAILPPERRDEFEELCLRIRPAHLWLGMLVGYNPNGTGSGSINLESMVYESLDYVQTGSGKIDLSTMTYESLDYVETGSGSIDLSTATYETGAT